MDSGDPPPSFFPGLVSNPSETHQVDIIVCAVLTWLIAAIFVGLRFYARGCLLQNAIGVEDWLIVLALVFSAATSAGMIEQAVYGLGKHFLDVDPNLMLPMRRAGWYSVLWYMLSLLATKTAILLLYLRVLSFRHARYIVYGILALVIGTNGVWTLYTVLTACTPLSSFWSWSPEPTTSTPDIWCRPQRDWLLNTALHIGTDVLLYLLPLPVLVRLQVSARQKAALYAVLALGLFVCVVSVVRLWDLATQTARADSTYENVSIPYLTVVEINAAIACACCMTLRPLVNRWFPKLWGSQGSESSPRDVERGLSGGSGRVREGRDRNRGPPTIGSKPLRTAQARRDALDASQLLDDAEDELGTLERDDKRSIPGEMGGGPWTETASESGQAWTPREPQEAHVADGEDAGCA